MRKLIVLQIVVFSCFMLQAQNVQKWETWQSDLLLTNGAALMDPGERNIGLQLWMDKGYGMELHFRNIYGTAIYTQSDQTAIWLGHYGMDKTRQQGFTPWMTLIGSKVGIGTTVPATKLDVRTGYISTRDADGYAGAFMQGQNGVAYFGSLGADRVAIGNASNSEMVNILNNGTVGIGTADPKGYRLTVGAGDIKSYNYDQNTGISIGAESSERPRIGFHVSDNNRRFKIEFNDVNSPSERLGIFTNNSGAWPETEVVSITKTGNLAIGTIDPKDYKLAVNGSAIFTKVKIKQAGSWPDYVFETSYKLPSLNEVEAFIQQHKHLPGVPSAKEVEKEGLDVGESQAVLLKKIEELTLYVIELKKENEEIKKRLEKSGK